MIAQQLLNGLIVGGVYALFAIGFGFRGPGRVNRYEGALLLSCYIGYIVYLITAMVV